MDRVEVSLKSKSLGQEHQDHEIPRKEHGANLRDVSRAGHPSSYYPVPSVIMLGTNPLEIPPPRLSAMDENTLCFEMLEIYESLLPTKESHERRLQLVNKINMILNNEWPTFDIKTHVFGLGTTYSDVDICIETNRKELENVRILAKSFKKNGMQKVQCIPWAKVPIVRLWDKDLCLACDINVNNTIALCNTRMIRTFIDIDPRVRPVALIIKYWTKQRQLSDAGNGGTLSTYAWTCMILNFLQMRQPPILPVLHDSSGTKPATWFNDDVDSLRGFGSANNESVGGLLYAFFRHYAVEFDYSRHVVSLRHGMYLDKSAKGWDFGHNYRMLCVEEPFDTSRNLGNSVDDISVFGLRREFQRGLASLNEQCSLALLCKPYISNIIPQTSQSKRDNMELNDGGSALERDTTAETIENTPCTDAPSKAKLAPVEPFSAPINRSDLDNIYTDTVARVKLPRRGSAVFVKRNS
ncbi:hypothetical protein Unana1_01440 [Umbelopsis nana]